MALRIHFYADRSSRLIISLYLNALFMRKNAVFKSPLFFPP
jgi:hypothetical protein